MPARVTGGHDAGPFPAATDQAGDDVVTARFVGRPNRFVVVADLAGGERVRAYLPNTGRLTHLVEPGTRYILRRDGRPPRVTAYTATRAWDGCWVALEASRAPRLLAEWLRAGNALGPFGMVTGIRAEVPVAGHRLDLLVESDSGPVWVEVKSGGRATGGVALLSGTPSVRGTAHLDALAGLARDGQPAAAAFVVQRDDAETFVIGGDADPGWIAAVQRAHDAGVEILAFGCRVTPTEVAIARPLPITWAV